MFASEPPVCGFVTLNAMSRIRRSERGSRALVGHEAEG